MKPTLSHARLSVVLSQFRLQPLPLGRGGTIVVHRLQQIVDHRQILARLLQQFASQFFVRDGTVGIPGLTLHWELIHVALGRFGREVHSIPIRRRQAQDADDE